MARVTVVGMEVLKNALKDRCTLDDVARVVRHNGQQMQEKAQRNADFKMGYQTGTTKRSISLAIKDAGMTAEVEPGTEYSPYLEYGTRFMEAQPFMKPAQEAQKKKFRSDLEKLLR
jgi:HK97 gp10 family phage protein